MAISVDALEYALSKKRFDKRYEKDVELFIRFAESAFSGKISCTNTHNLLFFSLAIHEKNINNNAGLVTINTLSFFRALHKKLTESKILKPNILMERFHNTFLFKLKKGIL
jgi:hypothetical protein